MKLKFGFKKEIKDITCFLVLRQVLQIKMDFKAIPITSRYIFCYYKVSKFSIPFFLLNILSVRFMLIYVLIKTFFFITELKIVFCLSLRTAIQKIKSHVKRFQICICKRNILHVLIFELSLCKVLKCF